MIPMSASEITDIRAAGEAGRADVANWTHGVYLKMADRATHLVFSTVGQTLRIKGIHLDGKREDATSHLSGGWREKLPTLRDGGRVAFMVHFDKNEASLNVTSGLAAAALAQTKETFQVSLMDGSGYQFSAFVGLEFDQPVRKKLLAIITLDISGAVTAI